MAVVFGTCLCICCIIIDEFIPYAVELVPLASFVEVDMWTVSCNEELLLGVCCEVIGVCITSCEVRVTPLISLAVEVVGTSCCEFEDMTLVRLTVEFADDTCFDV